MYCQVANRSVKIIPDLVFQSGLSDDHLKSLDEVYKGTYLKKYPIVGMMDYLSKQNFIHHHKPENPLTGEDLHQHNKDDL